MIPQQLPADIAGFAGRVAELSVLDDLLAAGADGLRTVCVSGMAGVGKTTLMVRWAHLVADRFPDGQLYMNLRGFDSAGVPVGSHEAVRDFLAALGLPPERIPPELDGRCSLFRSLLADRRILVVLDNARDAAQVRPLRPGCMTLVTSRNQLTGLVATDSAYPITLDVLSAEDARQLLSRRLGPAKIEAQSEAVERVVNACARLPLALAVAAARARQSGFSLEVIATDLDEDGQRLDALDIGDPSAQVRAVFSWSYQALTAASARLFRLLGLHPGPDISVSAAAAIAGRPLAQSRRMLTELSRANLLTESRPERYTRHDLLRDYATELVERQHSRAEREAGVRRLADYYLRSTHAADRLLFPHRDPIALPPASSGIRAEEFHARDTAMGWLSTERPTLVAMVPRGGQRAARPRLAARLGARRVP